MSYSRQIRIIFAHILHIPFPDDERPSLRSGSRTAFPSLRSGADIFLPPQGGRLGWGGDRKELLHPHLNPPEAQRREVRSSSRSAAQGCPFAAPLKGEEIDGFSLCDREECKFHRVSLSAPDSAPVGKRREGHWIFPLSLQRKSAQNAHCFVGIMGKTIWDGWSAS